MNLSRAIDEALARGYELGYADIDQLMTIVDYLASYAPPFDAQVPLSAHCAPALHLHAACAARRVQHIGWFHDHARIEAMLFDGAPRVRHGRIAPDPGRPGCGLALRHAGAQRYAAPSSG